MKSIIRKIFINFENEEKWLNEMAASGLQLTNYSLFRYVFDDGTPGEYIYRLELLSHLPHHPESASYIKFMEEVGIDCIGTHFRWIFFRKKASDGPFDLYTDLESRIKHYKSINHLFLWVFSLNLGALLYNAIIWLMIGLPRGMHINGLCTLLSLTMAVILTLVLSNYSKVLKKLKKEKQLFE